MIRKELLDKGYLELLETFGDELTIVNAARVSFGTKKETLSEGDTKLIKYLYEHEHMCYDEQTEVFTSKGWLKFPSFYNDPDVLIAAVDKNKTMRYEIPKFKSRYPYNGTMYKILTDDIDLCVTPNHKMYISEKGSNNFKFMNMSHLEDRKYHMMMGGILVTEDKKETDYIDGFSKGYSMYQKIRYGLSDEPIKEHIFKKSTSYRLGFMDGILDRMDRIENYYYNFTSRDTVNSLVRLATTLNISARAIKAGYCLDLSFPNPWINIKQKNDMKISYEGDIYCATTSTGLILVRRGYKFPVVCGNSPFRHLMFRFRIKMPEFVARQMYKHTIGCEVTSTHPVRDTAWNELCLSGESRIKFFDKEIQIKDLYSRFIENSEEIRNWDIICYDEEKKEFSLERIRDVYRRGICNVYSMKLENGFELRCTLSHNILTDKGWKTLEEIKRSSSFQVMTKKGLSRVIRVSYLKDTECYDISIQGTNNNFICEGIVVHNSGRYKPIIDYYYPDSWRRQSLNNKQGSDGILNLEIEDKAKMIFEDCMEKIKDSYSQLLDLGVAKEQARILLPLNMYTEVVWTCSAQAALHFIELRDKDDSQYEIRVYAEAMKEMIKDKFPILYSVWFK